MSARCLALALALSLPAMAGDSDELFPHRGGTAASFATGVPYLAIAELAYGISDRFAVGAVAGVTPVTYGVGLRARGVLFEAGSGRVVASMPLLYYPATRTLGHEPWVLAMPQILAERRLPSGARVHLGVGVAAATCTGAIADFFTGHHEHEAGEGFMGGLWNTATVGGSLSAGAFTIFADATAVLHGVRFASADWIGGPPVVLTLGARRGF